MKRNLFFTMMCLSSVVFYSCDKDDEVKPTNELPEEFSENTVEENKAQLEHNGVDLIGEMDALKDGTTLDAIVNLSDLLGHMDSEVEGSVSGRLITTLARIQDDKATSKDIYSAMRLTAAPPTADPVSIQDFFDIYGGTYDWMPDTQEWNFTEGGENITLNFPAIAGGTTNNASWRIRDYEGKVIENPLGEEYTGDLPTQLVMDMTIDDAVVLNFDFAAEYNNAGEPTRLDVSLGIAPFTYTIHLSNNTETAEFNYSLKTDEKTLIGFAIAVNGNFDNDVIENSEEVNEVVHNATVSFQAMNIKVGGNIDVNNLVNGLNQIDHTNENEAIKKEAELLNQHYDLVVYYADNNQKIADTEFYTFTDTRFEYNYETMTYEERDVLVIDMRLIFADGSKSDFETYFETGFEEFTTEIEALANEIE